MERINPFEGEELHPKEKQRIEIERELQRIEQRKAQLLEWLEVLESSD